MILAKFQSYLYNVLRYDRCDADAKPKTLVLYALARNSLCSIFYKIEFS